MADTHSDNSFFKILDYLFFARPMLIIPVWTILILGISRITVSTINSLTMALVVLSATGLSGAVFIMNQIFDIESDRINDKVHFLPKGYIKIGVAWAMFILLNLVSFAMAFFISFDVGLIAVVIAVLGVFYSAPPFTLKNRAYLAAFTNAIGHGSLIFLMGYCAAGGRLAVGLIKSAPYFFAVAGVYIGTTLPDIEGDRQTGKITLGVKIGISNSIILMFVSYMISMIISLIIYDYLFFAAALIVIPSYVWMLLVKNTRTIFMSLKLSIVILSLAAGCCFPAYLVFLVALICLTRFYYKRRFGIDYPSLG